MKLVFWFAVVAEITFISIASSKENSIIKRTLIHTNEFSNGTLNGIFP